jgi:hypothetical protein
MDDDRLRCDFCGRGIAPLDLIEGRAVVVFRKRYCPACMTETLRRSKTQRAAAPPPAPPPAPSPRATRRLKIGEHGCGLYGSEEERRGQLGPYLREGLESGDKVFHFLKTPTAEKVLGDFRAVGLQAQPYLKSGQLEILPASKLLGSGGGFVPSEMAARLRQAADRAFEDGYPRVRIVGEMTWALSSLIDGDRLVDYEQELTLLAQRGKFSALCQYNIYRFEASSLHRIRTCHPFVYAKGMAETVLRQLAPA